MKTGAEPLFRFRRAKSGKLLLEYILALTAMTDSLRQQHIAQARSALLDETRSATDALVDGWFDRAWIAESWRRCLAMGHRPEQRVGFDLVPANAPRHAEDEHRTLLTAARPELERLASAVAPIRYFAILTDAAGTVIDTAGAIDRADQRADAIARVGVDLSERSIGTSAIGSALGELQPVWLHRGEHFFVDTSVYSCAGAPIFGPQGLCVGMLDLTGIEVAERPELKHRVAHSARLIENTLALAVPHRLALRLNWPDEAFGGEGDGLICLDADGMIVSSNTSARQMLPALQTLARTPLHASELFALPWPTLFDQAGRATPLDTPLWSGLRLHLRAHAPQSASSQPAPRAAPRALKALETEMIHQAVRQSGGNVAEAARALGLSRATVYRRLNLGVPKQPPR